MAESLAIRGPRPHRLWLATVSKLNRYHHRGKVREITDEEFAERFRNDRRYYHHRIVASSLDGNEQMLTTYWQAGSTLCFILTRHILLHHR